MQTPDKLFTKDLSSFAQDEIRILFDRYQRIAALFGNDVKIRVPHAKECSKETITFAYERLSPTVEDVLFQESVVSDDVWRLAGEALGRIHRIDRTTAEDFGFVCGDFATKNMSLQKDVLVMFDLEPPPNKSGESFRAFVYNTAYFDVARFLLSVLQSHSFARPWRFWKNHSAAIRLFLESYTQTSGFSLSSEVLMCALRQSFVEWYADVRGGWMKKQMKGFAVRLSLWLHRYVYHSI